MELKNIERHSGETPSGFHRHVIARMAALYQLLDDPMSVSGGSLYIRMVGP